MEIKDLSQEERLVLVALVERVVQADGEYTTEEAGEVAKVSIAMGLETYNAAVQQARELLDTTEAIQAAAQKVQRPEARELILTAVQDLAVVDEVSREELQVVDWLAELWGF